MEIAQTTIDWGYVSEANLLRFIDHLRSKYKIKHLLTYNKEINFIPQLYISYKKSGKEYFVFANRVKIKGELK